MKICTRCRNEKDKKLFATRNKSNGGLSSWCKECFKEYDRLRYQNGDAGRKKVNWQTRVRRNREFIKNYLETHPCVDCGDTDWWALEFDHKDGSDKTKEVSTLILEAGIERIQKEINKCDVRCVKCHRKRTIFQFNWWHTEFLRAVAQSG